MSEEITLLPHQQAWVDWLLDPIGRECPNLPIGRGAGWSTALREAVLRDPANFDRTITIGEPGSADRHADARPSQDHLPRGHRDMQPSTDPAAEDGRVEVAVGDRDLGEDAVVGGAEGDAGRDPLTDLDVEVVEITEETTGEPIDADKIIESLPRDVEIEMLTDEGVLDDD